MAPSERGAVHAEVAPLDPSPAPAQRRSLTLVPPPPRRQPRSSSPRPQRRVVLGVPIDACSGEELVATVESWIDEGRRHMAVGVNANVVNMAHRDPAFRGALSQSGLNYADGQSIVWACRMLGHPVPERLGTTEAIYPLARNWAERGFGVFLYGGEPGIAVAAAARLVELFPDLEIAGIQHGYPSDAERASLIQRINESGARVLLVGLGNPRQELWVQEHIGELAPNAILTCGGLFDWTAGRHKRPPAFMVKLGLEWLYRLIIEPRRLFKRYVLGNPVFVARLLRTMLLEPATRASGSGSATSK